MSEDRRQASMFFTPPHIVAEIVNKGFDAALESIQSREACSYQETFRRIKILDPSCGAGTFLLHCHKFLIGELNQLGIASKDGFSSQLYGIDLNPTVIELARTAFQIQGLDSPHLRVGDCLLESIFPENSFDLIVGNPPYESLSVKETGKPWIAEQLEYFRSSPVLRFACEGKVDLYQLFLLRSYELLRPGGVCSTIVPMAFLSSKQSRKVRRFLFENAHFLSIEAFPEKDDPRRRVFEEAQLSTCIVTFVKGQDRGARFSVRVHPENKVETSWGDAVELNRLELEDFDSDLGFPVCKARDWNLVQQLSRDPYFVHLGSVAYSLQGEVNETIDSRSLKEYKEGSPILRGANLTRYALRENSRGKNWEIDGEFRSSKIKPTQHRLGFQRSSPVGNYRRLIAALIPAGHCCFDTIAYVTEDTCSIPLPVLMAYLNSKFAEWYFRILSTNSKINDYQFRRLPWLKFHQGQSSDVEIMNLAFGSDWESLLERLRTEGRPTWVFPMLTYLAYELERLESNRVLKSRRERSSLGEESQILQDFVDQVWFILFKIPPKMCEEIQETLAGTRVS